MLRCLLFVPTMFLVASVAAGSTASASSKPDPSRVLPEGQRPDDSRLGKHRELRDAYHPWTPPATKVVWEDTAKRLREQVLVSNGLWPQPARTPLNPVIHGRIDRDGYTIEKVYFASYPGHYVTGNLYRPKNISGNVAGVLCPHGHWASGRFYDAGEQAAQQQLDSRAEDFMAGARYPLQARMVGLVRMGCVVFHYDMVGYADSTQIPHREGFTDAQAGLRLQNAMGLQTWNSVRAVDFLLSLPEVDPQRIGVTGASGGGTQTFMLGAIDPRPAVAFPAVMVSTNMQGGCVCENADYLRQGVNNIAIAALFAPRPLAMSGADDWTIDIERKGLPELKQVYALYDKPELVAAKTWPEFKHNYNQRARELMYGWFNEHLGLGIEGPAKERDFDPVPPADLSVWTAEQPVPDDAKSAAELREYLTRVTDEQFAALLPRDEASLSEYRRVVGTAARVMLDAGVPARADIETIAGPDAGGDGWTLAKTQLGRKGAHEAVPAVVLKPEAEFRGTVIWIDGAGKSRLFDERGAPVDPVRRLLGQGLAVVSADVFLTGEFLGPDRAATYPVHEMYQGYTFGYNRPVLSNRVRDVLSVVGLVVAKKDGSSRPVYLVGTGAAGPWVLLARALAGDAVDQTVVDLGGFSFGRISTTSDPMFLPGALKFGGISGLAALAAPGKLAIFGTRDMSRDELNPLLAAYTVAGRDRLELREEPLTSEAVAERLLAGDDNQ